MCMPSYSSTEAVVIYRGGRSVGYGFVSFDSGEAAGLAVEQMCRVEVNGRAMNVVPAFARAPRDDEKSRKPRQNAAQAAEPEHPPAESASDPTQTLEQSVNQKRRKNRRKPKAVQDVVDGGGASDARIDIVDSQGEEKVTVAPKKNRRRRGKRVENQAVDENNLVDPPAAPAAEPHRSARRQRSPRDNSDRVLSKTLLYVSNIPFKMDSGSLKTLFTDYNVVNANVVRMRDGRSKGFGFIEVPSEDEQARLISDLQESKLNVDGRDLIVRVAFENASENVEI